LERWTGGRVRVDEGERGYVSSFLPEIEDERESREKAFGVSYAGK
jgi:hypothetical protein